MKSNYYHEYKRPIMVTVVVRTTNYSLYRAYLVTILVLAIHFTSDRRDFRFNEINNVV